MAPLFADTAAVHQLGQEKKVFRVSDTGVLEELGERFGQSPHMRRRRHGVVHAVYLMKGMSVANENRRACHRAPDFPLCELHSTDSTPRKNKTGEETGSKD
jgi:hypothetical protein